MSHTFQGKCGTRIFYDGGFDGVANIRYLPGGLEEVEVPISDLLDFVAGAIRQRRIEEMESMTTEEILFGTKGAN